MYRVFAIACGVLALAGCSSLNLDALKPAPPMDTVRFESDPPGAEARVSNGQTCRTPCALALPANATYNVTFTLNGYLPGAETLEVASIGDNTMQLRPNPVVVQLAPAPPPPKPRKAVRKRPAAKPKPKAAKQAAPPAPKPGSASRRSAAAASPQRSRRPGRPRSADGRFDARFVACRRATARWTGSSFLARLPI